MLIVVIGRASELRDPLSKFGEVAVRSIREDGYR